MSGSRHSSSPDLTSVTTPQGRVSVLFCIDIRAYLVNRGLDPLKQKKQTRLTSCQSFLVHSHQHEIGTTSEVLWVRSAPVEHWDDDVRVCVRRRRRVPRQSLWLLDRVSMFPEYHNLFRYIVHVSLRRWVIIGLLVDKDDLTNYQLCINYQLLIRTFTYQPTVDKTIVLSTNCWYWRVCW
jgi:hypothetical protein